MVFIYAIVTENVAGGRGFLFLSRYIGIVSGFQGVTGSIRDFKTQEFAAKNSADYAAFTSGNHYPIQNPTCKRNQKPS
jgi:hypothetical protein